jgi:diguanylate cyclase (GGDEF)-like protein
MTKRRERTPAIPPADSRQNGERRRLEVLYEVTRRLTAAPETAEILSLIVNEATHLLGADAAGLRLLEGDELVIKARTEAATAIMSRTRLKVGESLSGAIMARGEPVAVEDLQGDTRFDPAHKHQALERGFHGFLGVPLKTHGRIIGVLVVFTKSRRLFQPDEISLLSTFADQASVAIEKDRLLRQARDQAGRLRMLARVNQVVSSSLDLGEVLDALVGAAAQLTGAPVVGLWVAHDTERLLHLRALSDPSLLDDYPGVAIRYNEGLAGWVAVHRRPLDVPDLATDPRLLARDWFARHGLASAWFAPIVFHDSLLGVLGLMGRTPLRFDADAHDLLDMFIAQAGVAVRNARFYDELRAAHHVLEQRTRDLDLLNRMAELLQACVTEDEAYTVVARFVGQFFPEDGGAVFVTSASRNLLEARAVWGTASSTDTAVFKPEDCWALRRGRLHLVQDTSASLLCSHLPTPPPPAYLCLPLMAQGESLGVLHLSSSEAGAAERWSEAKQRMATTVADQLGLAVANLKLRETLRNQSIRDALTGLFNRRYLEETLERELSRARRTNASLGLIMMDLDHFKHFNDTFGHEAGDVLLREVGRLLQETVRGGDVACRYGGEEFVVILPEASAETTRLRAERLRESIKHLYVTQRGQSIGSVTASIGVGTFPQNGTTGDALVKAADTALYLAKGTGRDRVTVAE